jgi:hypothetical protein
MKRLSWSCAVILSACGVVACSSNGSSGDVEDDPAGTDTGNPFDEPDIDNGEGTAGGACDEDVTDVELDAGTALGFSANQVLAFAGGEHTVSLAWLDSNVEYGPESGRSEISVTVEPLAAHFVDRSPRTTSGGSEEGTPTIDIGTPLDGCRDSLRIDVRIGVSTTGGALAETVDTTLEATDVDFASGSFTIELGAIAGSFEATPVPPRNSEVTRSSLGFELGFSEYGAVGALNLISEFRSLDGNAVGIGGAGAIAHYPAENYCGQTNAFSVTSEQAVRGVSMAAALEALNTDEPVAVRYRSGASSVLDVAFTSSEERVCVSFGRDEQYNGEASGAVLEFAGRVALESADGRIDGSFPLTITAQTQNGELRTIASAQQSVQDAAQAAALPASFGVQDEIDFAAYGGGAVTFQSIVSSEQDGGSLVVNGLDIPECISNPQPPPPGANGSPGCRGIDFVPLWSAAWGDPLF